jgi:tetratricopeptide (TPR) repeat protein
LTANPRGSWAPFAADLNVALEHHRAGRLDRASKLYKRILDKAPGHPDALHMLGVIATSRGDPEQAIKFIGRAMGPLANHADAHLNLGNAHRVAGRPQEAIACYRRAIALKPRFAAAHSSLARELNRVRAFAEALSVARRAIEIEPGMAEAWLHAGAALQALGRLDDADACLREALARRPEFPEALQTLALIAVERSRFDEAVALQKQVVRARPKDANARCALGVYLFRARNTAEGLETLQHAVTLDPNLLAGWNNLGWAYRALGKFEDANACYERALEIDPKSVEAQRSLTVTGRTDADETNLSRLADTLADAKRSVSDRITAGFARAELLDKNDRYDEAFTCFTEANALMRQALMEAGRSYDPKAMEQRVDDLISQWTPDLFVALSAAGAESDRPVFVVGMPRSGTTLVEQIIASHSQAFGAGELPEIPRIAGELTPLSRDPGQFAAWTARARSLGAAHLSRLEALGGGASRIIDKLPDNLLHLGVIATLFPRAHVIFCERDPRDVCLSNYFQLFAGGNPWAYDLSECAHRFRQVARAADHWRRILPIAWLQVSYESLVSDPEGESRRMLEFLGLGWESACLEFHRTERVVVTSSTWQVRQKLFTRSVGRWRGYERHLEPLLSALPGTGRPAPVR